MPKKKRSPKYSVSREQKSVEINTDVESPKKTLCPELKTDKNLGSVRVFGNVTAPQFFTSQSPIPTDINID